jgi:hypothetical protein
LPNEARFPTTTHPLLQISGIITMLDPQDHSDFFVDDESDNEDVSGSQKNYTSHDLEKELRDILGESYDDGADGEDGEVKFEMVMVVWRL